MSEKDLSSTMSFLVDDMAKKLGSNKQFVMDSLAEMETKMNCTREGIINQLNEVSKEMHGLSQSLGETTNRSFVAINQNAEMKHRVGSLEKTNIAISRIEDDLSKLARNVSDVERFASDNLMDIYKKFKDASDAITELVKNDDKNVKRIDSLEKELNDGIKNIYTIIDPINKMVHKQEDQINHLYTIVADLKKSNQVFDHSLDDLDRCQKSFGVNFSDRLSALERVIDLKVSSKDMDDYKILFKRWLKEAEEKIPMIKEVSEFASDWREQIELKLARIERRMTDA